MHWPYTLGASNQRSSSSSPMELVTELDPPDDASDDAPTLTLDDALVEETETESDTAISSVDDLFRRRGLVAGWVIAWPFFVLTLSACAIAASLQGMQRPQLVPFTIGLYLCMGFFAYAYSIAWEVGAYVRQMLAMVAVVAILLALVALHLDDGSARWVYRGHERVLRPAQPLLRLVVSLDVLAILVIVSHGLGLGFGSRFFVRESGSRISGTFVKKRFRAGRRRLFGKPARSKRTKKSPAID